MNTDHIDSIVSTGRAPRLGAAATDETAHDADLGQFSHAQIRGRGFLLLRMRGAFRRWDRLANGVLLTAHHLHVPWMIPTTLIDAVALAFPSRRFRSAWTGVSAHSTRSLVAIAVVPATVLGESGPGRVILNRVAS